MDWVWAVSSWWTADWGQWTVEMDFNRALQCGPWISLAAPLTQIPLLYTPYTLQSVPSAEVETGRDGDRLGEFPSQVYIVVCYAMSPLSERVLMR